MSFMKFRNRKGFTLIEMMIVIAVIAILAAVIIPKTGIVQNTAKESGVEANARIVQGIVENLAPRYDDANKLMNAVAEKIGPDITNPITNGNEVVKDTATANATAVVYSANPPSSSPDNLNGVVWVQVESAGKAKIYSFDKKGNQIGEEIEVGK